MNMNYIEMFNVTKKYGNFVALNNVNLALQPGKIIGLLGPNGSGKTTMLKTLMRIIRQQYGTVRICGYDVCYETRRFVSFMPDRDFLYKTMSVRNAVQYYQESFQDFDINQFNYLAQVLKIDINADIEKLSKGNKEKVVLALTLSRRVPIYLLDEPLGSLDPVIKHEMLAVIKKCSQPNNLILISTHLIKDIEEILDDVVFLKNGNVVVNTSKNNILQTGRTLEQYYLEVFSNV